MVEVEIVIAIIGASVIVTSPFLALFIIKCCDKYENKPETDSNPDPDPEPEHKSESIEIYFTELLGPFF